MRMFMLLCAWLVVAQGCTVERSGAVAQAVAGPGDVTVSVRAEGQLAVSWTADPLASQYRVFQASGGSFALVANVFDSSGGSPTTSYIATGLSGGVLYCFEVQAVYPDGTMSGVSAAGCGVATGAAVAAARTLTFLPALTYNPGTWGPIDRWTDANGRTMIATTSLISDGSGRINIPHADGDILTSVTVFVAGNGASDAAFQVERFNIGIPGGFAALGPGTLDTNRDNVWASLPVSVSTTTLSAGDVVYLNMAPTPGAELGYHVGGVVVTFGN